jgi:hypothetical protein
MESFNKNPITIKELEKWFSNKNINPRTGRKISVDGKIYNYLDSLNIQELYLLSCIDDKDPVSLNNFWIIENNIKKIVHENIRNIIFYYDSNNLIRGFEKETLEYLKGYGISKHPVTQEIIPNEIFNKINPEKIINDNDKSIEDLALEVFQLFTNISFFIDYQQFLSLEKKHLLVLYYEIKDFYLENLNQEQRNQIYNNLFDLTKEQLSQNELIFIQKYILTKIKILLECNIEDYKFLINYILVGGLSLVIPQVKADYPDFSFSFNPL